MPDWRAFRRALGVTQRQMAWLLGESWSATQAREASELRGRHACPRASALLVLRVSLRESHWRGRLEAAGYAHPYPEDLT